MKEVAARHFIQTNVGWNGFKKLWPESLGYFIEHKVEHKQWDNPCHQLGNNVRRSCPLHTEQLIEDTQYA